jgi:hypothetical protein
MDHPLFLGEHINILELKIALESAKRWGHLWSGQHKHIHSDNTAMVAAINKETLRSSELMALIHELFWLSVSLNFKLSASHIPGIANVLADCISWLFDFRNASDALLILANYLEALIACKTHMTAESFVYVQDQWYRDSLSCQEKWSPTRDCLTQNPLNRPTRLI